MNPACRINQDDFDICTLNYRAPEIVFGDAQFGAAVDCWSLGIVLAEMAGSQFTLNCQDTSGYLQKLFVQLGSPQDARMRQLPLFPPCVKERNPRAWPESVLVALGRSGLQCLNGLLSYRPSERLCAEILVSSDYLNPQRFCLVKKNAGPQQFTKTEASRPEGEATGADPTEASCHTSQPQLEVSMFHGNRHDWNLLTGSVAPEVLMWLRDDENLQNDFGSLPLSFQEFRDCNSDKSFRKRAKIEIQRKCNIAGRTGACSSGKLNGLSVHELLPMPRMRAWVTAFRTVNKRALAEMLTVAKHFVRKLDAEERGKNGDHFLEADFDSWFLSCAEIHFINAEGFLRKEASSPKEQGASETLWEEGLHNDGGASILHMGLTLYGRRDVRFLQGSGLPDVLVSQEPGSVYLGGVTGARHQVGQGLTFVPRVFRLGMFGISMMCKKCYFD